jgi:hypothetical protein
VPGKARIAAAAVGLAVALLAGPGQSGASAGTTSATQRFFRSPSGNIECELDYGQAGLANAAYCQTFAPSRSVTLKPAGALKVCSGQGCIGNGPDNEKTLAYGSSTSLGPFRCTSLTSGVRCTLASGKGFAISRSGVTPTASGETIAHVHAELTPALPTPGTAREARHTLVCRAEPELRRARGALSDRPLCRASRSC